MTDPKQPMVMFDDAWWAEFWGEDPFYAYTEDCGLAASLLVRLIASGMVQRFGGEVQGFNTEQVPGLELSMEERLLVRLIENSLPVEENLKGSKV